VGAVSEGDVSPVEVGSGMVEMVKDFTCLGSNLSSDCEATCEVKCRITKASKAFGAIQTPIFSTCAGYFPQLLCSYYPDTDSGTSILLLNSCQLSLVCSADCFLDRRPQ